MDIHIGDVTSTVRVMDGEAILAPKTLNVIVQAVMQAIHEREQHQKRVRAEQKLYGSVNADQDNEV